MPSIASPILAFRRTLHIIRALQQAPRNREFLLNLVYQLEGEDAYGDAPDKAFEADKARAERFGIKIAYDGALQAYTIREIGEQGWVDLPDEVLDTLVFLYRTFDEGKPRAAEVRYALDTLLRYLPAGRAQRVMARHLDFVLEFRDLDSPIHPKVREKVQLAAQRGQVIRFYYLSPSNPTREPRLHEVAPRRVYHRDGHHYLSGYDRLGTSPTGEKAEPGERHFRLTRILPEGIQVLSEKLPPRSPRRYPLRYWLHPELARGEISHRFEKSEIQPLDGEWEGWVEVRAEITDEFAAARTLLSYGHKCRVWEPPGVVERIQEALWGMMALYYPEREGED